MGKISDQIVQLNDPEEFDDSTLKTPVFPVNMRLFRTSPFYRQIIMDCVQYLESHLNMTFQDYVSPKAISGAKLGLPFNIIAYKHGTNKKFCLNPVITMRSKEGIEVATKCGAVKMDKEIKVFRSNTIDLEFFDLKGQKSIERNIGRNEGGFMIQHEVDHNNGISIHEREIK